MLRKSHISYPLVGTFAHTVAVAELTTNGRWPVVELCNTAEQPARDKSKSESGKN